MKKERYFALLCNCLSIGLCVLFLTSYRIESTTQIDETSQPVIEEAEESSYRLAVLVLDLEEGEDIILRYYEDPAHEQEVIAFFQRLTGSQEVARVILSNAAAFDISPALAFALSWEESRYNVRALNRNTNETVDRGLFQLNSASFPKLSLDEFYDPQVNAHHGLAYLNWCFSIAGTDVAALAMYNAGHNRVRSAGTPKSTLDYISRILKRQREIETNFKIEYVRIAQEESIEKEIVEAKEKAPYRLSLLTPLGGR